MTDPKIDIYEIAKHAGVSVASVSRALNNKPGVGAALRERILAISEQLGYQPNFAAKELTSGKLNIIGVSMPRHSIELKPFYELFYRELTLALFQQGRLAVTFEHDDVAGLLHRCGSVIMLGKDNSNERIAQFQQSGIPCVSVDSFASSYAVVTEEVEGIYQLAKGLAGKGYQKITYLTSADKPYTGLDRVTGYQRAMEELDRQSQVLTTAITYNSSLSAYRSMRHYLSADRLDCDAIMCDTDEDAIGVMAALHDDGYRVPEDVAVTGFDDLPLIARDLTTIRQDIPLLVEQTLVVLDDAVHKRAPRRVTIPVSVIWRHSA